jgi:nickel-dependent lactate racemase
MKVTLAYGKQDLDLLLPDSYDVTVIEPRYVRGVSDPEEALKNALRSPVSSQSLSDMVKKTDTIGIVVNDITRATPYRTILPVLLNEMKDFPSNKITFFVALGTHREDSEQELRGMLGDPIVDGYRIVQNNCIDRATQVKIGVTQSGNEIWINREFSECELKLLTGFIEPHFFAGFSGGGKAVVPGMAGLQTIMKNHSPMNMDDKKAIWGITEGNPIWEEVHEAALMAGNSFLLNVALNKNQEITGVFAGDLTDAHRQGCKFVKNAAMVPVPRPFDIVVTSNSGYPLDLNLYQSVKGMSAAAQIVKMGGAIIVAADCWDGIPEHGLYGQILRESKTPQELLEKVRNSGSGKQDQWQAHIQAKIQIKADVYVRSGNLTNGQIESALLKPSHRIEETVDELIKRYGKSARICVLPEGPQTIPYLK